MGSFLIETELRLCRAIAVAAKDGAIANVHSILSMSSVATVLMAGNVQAKSIPPEGPVSATFIATHSSPQADVDRHRQRVNQVRAISSSVSGLR